MLYGSERFGSDARFGNDGNVHFLLMFDGANGGTTFLDSGTNKYSVTAAGTAALSTTQAKFGPTSLNAGNGSARIADNASLEPGTSDFTFELWVYPTSTGTTQYVFGKTAVFATDFSPFAIIKQVAGNVAISFSSNGTSWDVLSPTSIGTPTDNQWSHIAVVRSGTSFYGFLNGSVTSLVTSSASLVNNAGGFNIGNFSNDLGGASFVGFIDQVRYSNIARWIANFTPPPMPYGL